MRASDIDNDYIQAPVAEKIWTVLGSEFGPDAEKFSVVVRNLYGIKSSGDIFRNHLDDCMKNM